MLVSLLPGKFYMQYVIFLVCSPLGNSKLASMPAGGAVAVSSGGSAAPAGGPAPAAGKYNLS